jgi:hypothetical protein
MYNPFFTTLALQFGADLPPVQFWAFEKRKNHKTKV